MLKLLLGLPTFFFLATVIYAAATSIGFDKPEYLISPATSQQIYSQLVGPDGQLAKAIVATKIYLTPGSLTGQISKTISKPVFASAGATVYVTVSTGDSRKSFLYQDNSLGISYLTATGSGLLNGSLKITIGFPPPPPPPPVVLPPITLVVTSPLAPAPILTSEPVVVRVDPVVEVPKIVSTVPGTDLIPEPEPLATPNSVASSVKADRPQVLGQQVAVSPDLGFRFIDQIISWFMRLLSDNIGL